MDEAMVDPKAFLLKLNKNLNILQEREAKYAGNPPSISSTKSPTIKLPLA